MAAHISSVAASDIPKVAKDEFYRQARSGDLLFVSGIAAISRTIEDETKSLWSHVAQLWLPPDSDVWLVLEATIQHGVSVTPLASYADGGDGSIVLARRPALTDADHRLVRNRMLGILGEQYDWQDEVKIAASKLLSSMAVKPLTNEEYCSGYQWYGSCALPSDLQLKHPESYAPTPEDNWTDPSVQPVCAVLY